MTDIPGFTVKREITVDKHRMMGPLATTEKKQSTITRRMEYWENPKSDYLDTVRKL